MGSKGEEGERSFFFCKNEKQDHKRSRESSRDLILALDTTESSFDGNDVNRKRKGRSEKVEADTAVEAPDAVCVEDRLCNRSHRLILCVCLHTGPDGHQGVSHSFEHSTCSE